MAVTLETARILLAGSPLRNDVILLFTDGEEPAPRHGSNAFVDDHRWFDDVRFIVNLEAIGTGGPSMLIETNGPQSWILDQLVDSAPQPVTFSFLTETTELIGGSNTDFAPSKSTGVPGVEFVYSRGSSIYHTARDTPDSVSRRSLHSHGVNTLGLVRRLAAEDLVVTGGDDMVFFTVGRFHVVRYPTSLGTLIVVAAGVVLFAAVRRRRIWAGMARGAATTLVAAFALLLGSDAAPCWRSLAPALLTIGVTMVVLIPAIDTFFQFAQPRPGNSDSEILPIVAVPVLLVALGMQLVLALRPQREAEATDDLGADEPTSPARSGRQGKRKTAGSR